MNDGVKQYIEMQKKLYIDKVCGGDYETAKRIIGCTDYIFSNETFSKERKHILQGRVFEKALDFGCGVGRLIAAFHNKIKHIDGVDLSPEMLKYARIFLSEKNIPPHSYSLFQCNGYDLNMLIDDEYDLVYSQNVLHHI